MFITNSTEQLKSKNPEYINKVSLYNLLLNTKYRKIYNDYLMNNIFNQKEKKYTEIYNKGGKRRKLTKRKQTKRKQTKRKQTKRKLTKRKQTKKKLTKRRL